MGYFFPYRGLVSMSGKDNGIVWQLGQLSQALDHEKHGSAREVCPSYGMLEEGISGESNMFRLAIEGDRSLGMPRRLDN